MCLCVYVSMVCQRCMLYDDMYSHDTEPIDFPSKMVSCRFNLDLPLFGLGPSSKGCGSKLWLPTNRIALFH